MKLFFKKLLTILIWIFICSLSINCNKKSTNPDDLINDIEFPFKNYLLDNDGQIIHSDMNVSDFQNSNDCAECHPNHYEEWNKSPHSRSHTNLFFQKCVIETIEEHGSNSKKFCDQCHDPISVIAEKIDDENFLQGGVTCDVCHTMTKKSLPTIALPHEIVTSQFFLNPGEGIKYGAMENPQENSYHESVFNPIFNQSELCLPCHDLRKGDLEAEITFTEWNRIPGMAMSGAFPCQQCHMLEKEDGTHEHHFAGVDLSYENPPEQEPLYHETVDLLKTAAVISFSSSIAQLPDTLIWNNLFSIPIRIESLTGHHLPSGTSFNRECWISIEVREENENGDLIYQNGVLNSNIQLLNYNDEKLVYFTSFLLTEEGDTTQDILKATEIINYSLPGLNVKYAEFPIELNNLISSIWIKAKLNFRPIKPFLFDDLPLLKPNIPIFTIDEIEKTIQIIN